MRTGSLPSGSTVYQTARFFFFFFFFPIEVDGRMRAPTSDRADTI
ncbi:MAG: hypothetical protein ABGY24_11680 [bacterium]